MSNPIKFEVVLIWSRAEPSSEPGARVFSAFNRVFDTYPTDIELATVVSDKNAEIESGVMRDQDPQFHRMELRTVETQAIDLTDIVAEYNETYYPDPDRGDEDDGC